MTYPEQKLVTRYFFSDVKQAFKKYPVQNFVSHWSAERTPSIPIQADLIWSDHPFTVIVLCSFFCPLPEHFPRCALVARGEAVALRRARAPRLLCAWHAHLARSRLQHARRARFLHRTELLRAVALRRARATRLLCAWHAHVARSGIQHARRARFLHRSWLLKGLSHEIDFKNFDKKLHNLA
jgi:hypothetical protein